MSKYTCLEVRKRSIRCLLANSTY